MSVYQGRSFRLSGIAQCGDISVSYDWMEESGSVCLCRAMRDAGKPDGAMDFTDDTTSHISSIHQWAAHQPTYRGTFFRPRVITQERWKQCDDVRVIAEPHEDTTVKLCRAMLAAAKPEGDLLLVEAGVKREFALRFYIPSITRWAAYPLIAAIDDLPTKVCPPRPVSPRPATAVIGGTLDYATMTPDDLAAFAISLGIKMNGDGLAQRLHRLDELIGSHSLDTIETMARRLNVKVGYGKGNKGEPLKKRLNLVAIINAGHDLG